MEQNPRYNRVVWISLMTGYNEVSDVTVIYNSSSLARRRSVCLSLWCSAVIWCLAVVLEMCLLYLFYTDKIDNVLFTMFCTVFYEQSRIITPNNQPQSLSNWCNITRGSGFIITYVGTVIYYDVYSYYKLQFRALFSSLTWINLVK